MITKLNKAIFITVLFALTVLQVFAQKTGRYVWKEKSESGYTYKFVENDPFNTRFYTLKNGLTVILSPSIKQPRIQAYITTKAGSKVDPADHTGLAHYLEHLLFKGTDKIGTSNWAKEKPLLDQIEVLYERYNSSKDDTDRAAIYKEIDHVSGEAAKYSIANEYDKIMGSIGATGTNAFTSFDQTAYTEDIPSNAVDQFLAVQRERFRRPVFRLFHTELEAVYEEKNMSLDNDNRKVMEVMFQANFPNHNYGRQTILGSVEHLKNPSLKAIQNFYDTYYVPNHMAVILSGDFDPSQIIVKVDQAFSFMQQKEIPTTAFNKEENIIKPVFREVIGPNPEFLMLTYRMQGAGTKEAKMLQLISSVLSNRAAGLIDLNIVKSQKLLGASAFPYVLNDYSLLVLQGNPLQGQSLDEVRDLLLTELVKLKEGSFSDGLLESIVNNELKTQLNRRESYKDRADDLMSVFASELDWAEELNYSNWLSTITKQDIVDFAKKHFNENGYVAIYKRQGTDPNMIKVVKPEITPVTVNRSDKSVFFTSIEKMAEAKINPVWVDYEKAIQRGKLDGLNVYATKNYDNELFSLTYHFKTGKWNNKLLGLAASYLEYLGTKSKSSEDFSKEFYNLATEFKIYAGNDETAITVSGLNSKFKQSVQLLQDLIHNCVADEKAFDAYLARLKKSRTNAKENKGAIVEGLIAYAQYGAKNPFNFTFTDSELDQVKATDLVEAIHQLTNIEHTILYYGPISATDIAKTISGLKRRKGSYSKPAEDVLFTELPTSESKVLFAPFPMKQVDISWFRNAGIYNSGSTPVISLFNSYFGGGMGSIVFQTIRESKALAYSTYANFVQPARMGKNYSIRAYVGTQADKFNDAIEGMNDLLNALPVSEIGLIAAKTNLTKSLASQRITDAGILNSFINSQRLGNNTDIRKDIYEKVAEIGYPELQKFHAKEFSNKPYVYCIVGEEANINKDDIKKLGKVEKLSLLDIFGY